MCAPWTIGNALVAYFLGKNCSVTWADWDGLACPSDRVDLLIGHPHGEPGRAFELAASVNPWARRIAICPWNGRPDWQARLDDLLRRGVYQHLLAICGPYWAERLPWSPESVTPVAAAADENVWTTPLDERYPAAAYVGCVAPGKGTEYLAEVSRHCQVPVHHFGYGAIGGRVVEHGFMPNGTWRQAAGTSCIVACGDHDANPFSLLEGALLGMVPVCTPTCGWGDDLAVHIPADDPKTAAEIVDSCAYKRARGDMASRRPAALAYSWRRFFETLDRAVRRAVGA